VTSKNPLLALARFPRRRGLYATFIFFIIITLFADPTSTRAQSSDLPQLLITPSTLTLLVGEDAALSAVDSTGRPSLDVRWSLSEPIADLHPEDAEIQLKATTAGRAILTATRDGLSATAVVTVLAGDKPPSGTVRWSLDPTPGFATLHLQQTGAVPDSSVGFYSIEWNSSSNAVVRALRDSGQQLWRITLSSSASPTTLKSSIPPGGNMYLNDQVVTMADVQSGFKEPLVSTIQPQLSSSGLPLDGKSILLRTSGDDFGGLLVLEGGRFRDSIVNISPVDGSEVWRYRSEGRLARNWSANYQGDVGIVETLAKPISSGLVVLNGKTGEVRFRIPFPPVTTTVKGFKCVNSNVLHSLGPAPAGSVFTSVDGNMYVQVEGHLESEDLVDCKFTQWSFDNSLSLLQVKPSGEADWKTFQHIHADGNGSFHVQPRVFVGESIPDGQDGVLAAWTYFFPGSKEKNGEKSHFEARLSRIGPLGQFDYTLPMALWTPGINSLFDENMILAENNVALYATNKHFLLRFEIKPGEVKWVRNPPTGEVDLQFSTAGGGLMVTNAGQLTYFDAQGNGLALPCTVLVSNPKDIGLVQTDLLDHTSQPPLQLREIDFQGAGSFFGVEDGQPYGRGSLLMFTVR
jgi:outer membrane protein assembly factor BamB